MRVMWVADKLGYGERLHGIGAYFKYVIPALADQTIVPVALRCGEEIRQHLAGEGVEVRCLNHMKIDPRTPLALQNIVREEKIDLLHLHGYGASAFGRMVARRLQMPVIIHRHDSDSRLPWYGRVVDSVLRHSNDSVIAVSESVADFGIRARSFDRSQVHVMPNPCPDPHPYSETDIGRLRAELGIPKGGKLVGCVTRFDPVKANQFAIRAFADVVRQVDSAYLVLLGDGDERASLERLVSDLHLNKNVRFLGHRPDASRYFAAFDCYLLSSINEGVPFTLLEALAAGTPAVATSVGGIPEFFRNEEGVLIVPPQDPAAMSRAVSRVLSDAGFAAKVRDRGLQKSRQLGLTPHCANLMKLYEQAIASQGTSRKLRNA